MNETDKPVYSDKEINEISDWLNELTIDQLFFLRDSYQAFLAMQTINMENNLVH